VSRAGAIAISELCHIGKPVIFVPYPYAAENHQYKNAEALVEKQAAHLIPDAKVSDELPNAIITLLNDVAKMTLFSKNIKSLAANDADMRIAAEVINLVVGRNEKVLCRNFRHDTHRGAVMKEKESSK
jgi:UDP-N-acetylglucosamine--N-acetylmuramyl-(pentapeptide) pyrophosphoryl-undecaprenol N-acetylglucosamine transferase